MFPTVLFLVDIVVVQCVIDQTNQLFSVFRIFLRESLETSTFWRVLGSVISLFRKTIDYYLGRTANAKT